MTMVLDVVKYNAYVYGLLTYIIDISYFMHTHTSILTCTVLVIIKLTKFAVPLRLRCGSGKFIFCHNCIIPVLYFQTDNKLTDKAQCYQSPRLYQSVYF